jgi:hypothetical protein
VLALQLKTNADSEAVRVISVRNLIKVPPEQKGRSRDEVDRNLIIRKRSSRSRTSSENAKIFTTARDHLLARGEQMPALGAVGSKTTDPAN